MTGPLFLPISRNLLATADSEAILRCPSQTSGPWRQLSDDAEQSREDHGAAGPSYASFHGFPTKSWRKRHPRLRHRAFYSEDVTDSTIARLGHELRRSVTPFMIMMMVN